ncbi:MAG: hypothetical protein RSB91_03100 [Clostridia bacterium]
MLTGTQFTVLTGQAVPDDFALCEGLACEAVHAHTLHAFVGREVSALPSCIADRLQLAVALQTLAISEGGGVSAAAEPSMGGVTLGRFSIGGAGSGGAYALSPTVRALLSLPMAYARGIRACD